MSNRRLFRCAGAIVGLLLLGSGIGHRAMGQNPPPKPVTQTPKKKPVVSDQRVKVQKTQTAGGEVKLAPCPIDQDSVDRALSALRREQSEREQQAREAQRLLDSAFAATQLQALTDRLRSEAAAARQKQIDDSIAFALKAAEEAALARKHHLARGFYIGAAGGTSMPQREIRNGYAGGWNAMIPFGWDASEAPFGFRADLAVDHLNGTLVQNPGPVTTAASGDITVWSLNTDLKLRAATPGTKTRSHLYALGGVGAHKVMNGVYGTSGPLAGKKLSFNDAKTSFGWNVGAGASMEFGAAELFFEARFLQIKSDLPYHTNGGVGTYTSFTPIVVGLQFF